VFGQLLCASEAQRARGRQSQSIESWLLTRTDLFSLSLSLVVSLPHTLDAIKRRRSSLSLSACPFHQRERGKGCARSRADGGPSSQQPARPSQIKSNAIYLWRVRSHLQSCEIAQGLLSILDIPRALPEIHRPQQIYNRIIDFDSNP